MDDETIPKKKGTKKKRTKEGSSDESCEDDQEEQNTQTIKGRKSTTLNQSIQSYKSGVSRKRGKTIKEYIASFYGE